MKVMQSNVLPQSNPDKGEYFPNENGADLNIDNNNSVENSSVLDGTEVPAKEDLNVDNNIVLPQTSTDSSVLDLNVHSNNSVENSSVLDLNSVENSSVLDGTAVPAKEDLNVDNNSSVLDGT